MAKRKDWSRGRFHFELEKAGVTSLYDVDRAHSLPLGTISKAIRVPHRVGETILARILKVQPEEIWPSRYDSAGRRLRPQPMTNYRREREAGHCQKRRAA